MNRMLSNVVADLEARQNLPRQQKRNMVSSLRTLARVCDRPLERIPADAAYLEELMRGASPGAFGLSSSRWPNVKSDVRRALRHDRGSTPLTTTGSDIDEHWQRILELPDHTAVRCNLRRFAGYCNAIGICPEEVGEDTVDGFLEHLRTDLQSSNPMRSLKDLIRNWNRFVATSESSRFVPLHPRRAKRKYTLQWHDLPEGLASDAERFRLYQLGPDSASSIFSETAPRKPVRPATAAQRDRMLRRLASAEILAGVPKEEIGSLAALVQPDRLKLGLEFFLMKAEGQTSVQVEQMIHLAVLIAKNWAKLPDSDISKIQSWAKRCRREQVGLTDKNRTRLRQFTDQATLRNLAAFPYELIAKARRKPSGYSTALDMQTAIAIGILLVAPIRIGNLATLDRDRHFQRSLTAYKAQMHLVLPKNEVKNKIDLEYPVPEPLMHAIEDYMQNWQPLLTANFSNGLLFPGRQGQPKTTNKVAERIVRTIDRELGLKMNPHLFRHLAALIFLKRYPGHYESVRQLLGHRSIQTTINFYASFETNEAMRRYDDIVIDLQSETAIQRLKIAAPEISPK